MDINVNGKFKPVFSLVVVLSIILILPLMNFSQDIEGSMNQLNQLGNNSFTRLFMLISQAVASIFLFIILPFVWLKISNVKVRETYFYTSNYNFTSYIILGLLVIAFMPFDGYIAELNSQIPFPDKLIQMEKALETMMENLLQFDSVFEMLIGVLVIGLVAGISEEFVFRGVLQNLFNTVIKNHHLAIWITAILFSAIHMQFLGFIPRMLLGALFGYVYYWSGNLSLAMFGHFVNNGFTVVMLYMHQQGIITTDIESTENVPITAVLISLVLSIGLLYYLKNKLEFINLKS